MERKKTYLILLIIFFSLLFFLRLIHLGADPPRDLSRSMGYMGDPGTYVSNARNKIVFGRWEMDMWNIMYISPLPHYLTYLTFIIFGIGIAQMNFIPVLFSCLILILSFLILKNIHHRTFALLGTFLLGVNYQFIMFSRIAVRVMPLIFLVMLALYFLTVKEKRIPWNFPWIFLAGISCFLSFTVKGTFLLILPAFVLGFSLYSFFQNQKKLSKTFIPLALLFLGMALTFIVWFFIFYNPHKEIFLAYGAENYRVLTPHSFNEVFKNFWIRPLFYFSEMPILASLSFIYLLIIFFKALTSPKKISLVDWFCGLWIISNMLYFSFIYYQAARHFIPLIFPVILLSIGFLRSLYELKAIQRPKKSPFLFFPFLFLWLIFLLSSVFIIISRPSTLHGMQRKSFLTIGLSLIVTLITFFLLRYWPRGIRIHLSKTAKVAVILVLILVSVFSDGKKYMGWALQSRYDVKNISRDFDKAFDHMVIAGLTAPVISLENRHEAHEYYTDYINPGKDFIQKYNITHIFTTTYAVEKKYYQRDFPGIMKKAKLLARYYLWKDYVELYEVIPSSHFQDKEEDFYEGEIFYSKKGIPRYDSNASGKLAFLAEKGKKNFLLELPGLEYPPGRYKAIFRLKGENKISEKGRIARIDVVNPKRKKVYAFKNLYSHELSLPGQYQDFSLSFNLTRKSIISLRIYGEGTMNLWIDKVTIQF